MGRRLGLITLLVDDYDHAIAYYSDKLGFKLLEDTPLDDAKRWVVMMPAGAAGTGILLAKAATLEQRTAIGHQAGGRVFLFLYTDDFHRDHERMVTKGVRFLEQPRSESYGIVAVFEDFYGNRWDLLQPLS